MGIDFEENKVLSGISIGKFITLFEAEMKKLDYFHNTIHHRILMIKRAYSGDTCLIDEEEMYSSEKLYSWLLAQKVRLEAGNLSHERYLYMESTLDLCEELYHSGSLERRGRRRKYTKYIPKCYEKIQKEFLQSLSCHMASRTLERYELNSRQFWTFLENHGIYDISYITRSCIEEYLSDSSKLRKDSIDKDVLMLKRLFAFLNSELIYRLRNRFQYAEASRKTKIRTSAFFT